MSCSNKKCNKKIISSFNCNKCSCEFCSNKCLTEHLSQDHKSKHLRIPVKMESKRSIFNFEGRILKEFIDDPIYNFKNFEFVRTQTNKIQTIGSGAFGNVFLSRNIKDNQLYAIKHIRKSKMIASGESLDIIYREISIHRLLLHDNIIRLFSHTEDEDNIFMIMEYADSGTLFHLIRQKGGLNEAEAFKYFIQSASAVAFLHENGYAHRDVKPENLLLTKGNQIKLCDFGWCVDASSGERGTFCGTYEYMAPEIVKEVPYDKSIDAWSLGILLYELIHGYSPFRAEKDKGDDKYQEIFKNIIKHKYTIEKDIGKACADLISSN